jgi:hypothetical protein
MPVTFSPAQAIAAIAAQATANAALRDQTVNDTVPLQKKRCVQIPSLRARRHTERTCDPALSM